MELISSVDISEDMVVVRAGEGFAREYLREDFWARYERVGGGEAVDPGLAAIPFLTNVAPVVWLAGIEASVPALDRTLASALDDVRAVYAEMYPNLRWEGSINAEHLTKPEASAEQAALLFSGGVDSVYSSVTLGGSQLLVTVRGSDIALENDRGWNAVRESATGFARSRGHRNAFVETNFRRFLNIPVLEKRWSEVGEWWPNVQHGIGLLGLVAPLVPAGRVVIAATHTPSIGKRAWGSNPRLDTAVRWGSVEVDHQGYEVSRQRKVEAIVADAGPPPELRVCYSNPYGDGQNCGHCEKCLRTFTALLAAGANPADYGLPMSPEAGARRVRRRFQTYRVAFNATKPWHWGDLQAGLERSREAGKIPDDGDVGDFLSWVSDFDFATYERRWRLVLKARARLLRAMRRVPVTEQIARRVLAASHRTRSRIESLARR